MVKSVPPPTLGVYARLSMQGEDEESIKRQLRDGFDYAKFNNLTPVEYLEPHGRRSGVSEKRRPSYRKLKEDIKAGQLRAVWFADLARASRSLIELFALIQLCQDNGVQFVSQKENIDPQSAIGRAMLGVIGVFNQWYSQDLSERQKRRAKFRKDNNQTLGKIPLGLRRNANKQYEPSDESYQAPTDPPVRTYLATVLRLLELYQTSDVGAPEIARRLVLEGFCWRSNDKEPIPVQEYHVTWTLKILESYANCVPKDLLTRCIAIRSKRSRHSFNGNKRELPPPLLWRILFCARCGKPYVTSSSNVFYTVLSGQKKRVLSMRYLHPSVHCHQMKTQYTFKSDRFDNQMLEIIVWVLSRSEAEKDAAARAMSTVQAPVPGIDAEAVKSKLGRLKTLFVMGHISEADYLQQHDELQALLVSPVVALDVMDYETARKVIDDLPAALLYAAEADPTLANQIIRELIERVEVSDGHITTFHPHPKYFPLFDGHPLCVRR